MKENELKLDFSDIPEICEARQVKRKMRILPAAVTFCAAILIFASLTVHTLLFAKAAEIMKKDGGDILLSMVIPKKEPVKAEKKEPVPKKEPEKQETESKDHGYINCDLSAASENAMEIMNETSYTPDITKLFSSKKPIPSRAKIYDKYGKDAPLVLIYHTHGTEAYAECASCGYRTEDTSLNVVAVGDVITDSLTKKGIGTIHIKEMFDIEDFNTAYDRSTEAVRDVLADNPSIQYVLDIHRDSVDRNGDYIKCMSEIDGKECAQLMLVCGTDEGGSDHKKWQNNLTFSLQLQSSLWEKSPSLMRAIDLKEASFYQDTRAGALIVEFGTSANTLEEAKSSARIFADTLSEYMEK